MVTAERQELQKRAKLTSNWLLGEFTRLLKVYGIKLEDTLVTPRQMFDFVTLQLTGRLGGPAAKEVFEEMFRTGRCATDIVEERGLTQLSDEPGVIEVIEKVMVDNPKAVADYQAGRKEAIKYLMGQAMKLTLGRITPTLAEKILRERLA